MNLHMMAKGAISIVNPMIEATLRKGTGYTTEDDGSRTPTFEETTGDIQVQGISNEQLYYLDQQGFEGILKAVYLYGEWSGIVKTDNDGGDILLFSGYEWLVVKVDEAWNGMWSKVIVCQQSAL